ncbi:conserved hypothetical protein, partial [Ricinus communis]
MYTARSRPSPTLELAYEQASNALFEVSRQAGRAETARQPCARAETGVADPLPDQSQARFPGLQPDRRGQRHRPGAHRHQPAAGAGPGVGAPARGDAAGARRHAGHQLPRHAPAGPERGAGRPDGAQGAGAAGVGPAVVRAGAAGGARTPSGRTRISPWSTRP